MSNNKRLEKKTKKELIQTMETLYRNMDQFQEENYELKRKIESLTKPLKDKSANTKRLQKHTKQELIGSLQRAHEKIRNHEKEQDRLKAKSTKLMNENIRLRKQKTPETLSKEEEKSLMQNNKHDLVNLVRLLKDKNKELRQDLKQVGTVSMNDFQKVRDIEAELDMVRLLNQKLLDINNSQNKLIQQLMYKKI